MVESGLFTFFSRLAQAFVWTKTKAFYQGFKVFASSSSRKTSIFPKPKPGLDTIDEMVKV